MNSESITASAITQSINVPIVNMFGISAYPRIGDEVVLVPIGNGEYVCIGCILKASRRMPIEILDSGDVLINNTPITQNEYRIEGELPNHANT